MMASNPLTSPQLLPFSASPTRSVSTKAELESIQRAPAPIRRPFRAPSSTNSNGLRGQYFDNANFTKPKLTRTDTNINFNWGRGAPAAVEADTFSVRWTGKIQPRYSEQYRFSTRANDGVRLWVNGKKLIDRWQSRPTARTNAGTIQLEAGKLYNLKLEYYENKGNAMVKLFWSSPQQTREIVPTSHLFTSATPTPLPNIQLSRYTGGFKNPTDIVSANDGSNRLYVLEQAGTIRTVENGTLQPSLFLDISNRVKSGGEEGLLSLAFPPNYANKRHFYVYYTNQNSDIVISRFRLKAGSNQADANSETVLLTIPHPNFTNHNGGKLAFGPDGYLYISVGDGGGAGDPNNNAQNPASLLGKVLRVDVESPGVATYTIPSTNPFLANADPANRYRDEIWALGLRNPWRISFDRQTGDLYIADVGQNQREEVNFQSATSSGGENYGWKIFEGTQPYSEGNTAGLVAPLVEYAHTEGISVTGGYVYRGGEFLTLQGTYFYGDFANGKIWGVRRTGSTVENKLLLDSAYGISTFGEDEQGNLYVADYFNGDVYKLNAV
jgi:glucose/arabinose dehydrogenase